jgi:hypothetical protein
MANQPPLLSIILANVQSLDNKVDMLRVRISFQRMATGFSVHRTNMKNELYGKTKGGGVCFMINNSCCDNNNIHN